MKLCYCRAYLDIFCVFMTEKLREQFGFEEYKDSGGRLLDKDTYGELISLVNQMETNPMPVRKIFIDQAISMGDFTGVEITQQEAYLYGILCQGFLGRYLSQQPLLAEAMRVIGNLDKRNTFIEKYHPQINFDIDLMQRRAP